MVLNQQARAWIMALAWGLAWSAALQAQSGQLPSRKEMKMVQSSYPGKVETLPVATLPDSSLQYMHADDRIYLVREDQNEVAYLLTTSALGRYDHFDYASLWTREAVLIKVVITTYRSTHGAAICQKRWLAQFENYQGEELQLGKDIDAVSGGTISASALIKDLERSHRLMKFLIRSD
jgi:hypothetical protein